MKRTGDYRSIGAAAVGAGSTLILLQMLIWFYAQTVIWTSGGTTAQGQVAGFFLLESVWLLLIVLGSYSLYRSLEPPIRRADGRWSVAEVLVNAVRSRGDVRIGVIAGIIYAIFYAVVSSMIVYQPSVDFTQAYGATSPGWSAVACCGGYGTIPMVVVYLSPQPRWPWLSRRINSPSSSSAYRFCFSAPSSWRGASRRAYRTGAELIRREG